MKIIIAAATLSMVALLAQAKQDLPKVDEQGLHLISNPVFSIVYADPEADLKTYKRVKLLDTYVAFRKNWQKNYNSSSTIRVKDSDMERIRQRLAKEFTAVFTQVLEENDGYPVVDKIGPDVLLVRAAIVDLDPNAPDIPSAGSHQIYAESAGAMTLYIELFDSQTGDMLARALDRKADRRSSFMTWMNSATNSQAARRILRVWAQSLRDALDKAHNYSGEQKN